MIVFKVAIASGSPGHKVEFEKVKILDRDDCHFERVNKMKAKINKFVLY